MPIYEYENTKTGEVFTKLLPVAKRDFPCKKRFVRRVITAPNLSLISDVGGREDKAREQILQAAEDGYKEREIKERSDSEDVSMSIADYYRKSLEQKREGDTEILGYFDDPEDSKLPVTEDTTEYLDSVVDKDREQAAKDKERQERKEKTKIKELEGESTDIFAEDVEYIDREEIETSTYLELFNAEERQQQKQEEKIVEQRKAVEKREEKEEKAI